jgi:hypothetical protein
MRQSERKHFKIQKAQWSRATTTSLVNEVFETFFPEQLDKDQEQQNKVCTGQ